MLESIHRPLTFHTLSKFTYILDTEITGLVDPHMNEVVYSIVDFINDKVTVLQTLRAKRFNLSKKSA